MNINKDPLLLLASLSWQHINLKPVSFLKLLKDYKKYQFSAKDTWRYLPLHLQDKLKSKPFWWKKSLEQLQWSVEKNIKFAYPGHPDYPSSLIESLNYSPLLSYIGKPLNQYKQPLLAVVGSRHPNQEALDWMDSVLAPFIKQKHLACVSGGARGIDQHSHNISIRNKVPTIAFLPTGFKHIYPSSFIPYVKAIKESDGSVVSLFSPDTDLRKYNFHKRNFLIAALSSHVFMVLGQKKSGSLLTAKLAIQLNKEVSSLPQSPCSIFSGNLDLIKEGAQILSNIEDLQSWIKL